jgi:hypothetical protein
MKEKKGFKRAKAMKERWEARVLEGEGDSGLGEESGEL